MRFPVRLRLVFGVCLVVAGLLPAVAVGAPSVHPFEIVPGSFSFVPSSLQAGAHADWVTAFDFAHEADGVTYDDARNIVVELPTGFDASNTAVPTCTQAQLEATGRLGSSGLLPECPVASQVGQLSVEIALPDKPTPYQLTVPVYNMEVTSFGTTAELGYKTVAFTGLLQVQVRSRDLGLTATTPNIPDTGEVHNIKFTVWGLPASPEHDAQRGEICGANGEIPAVCRDELGGPQPAGVAVKPFLANPTSCGFFEARMEADSWEQPFAWTKASDQGGPIVECERVQFDPSIEVQPSTRSVESPTGVEVSLVVPQTWESEGQFTLATSYLQDAKVTLPEGMTANPGLAEGLGACTPEEYERETVESLPGEGCPPESKIGSIAIETPLLAETIKGAIYIATPYDNPFSEEGHPNGSLLALYVVAKDPERGILIKVAGKITPNKETGQLVTTFDENPQQPFSKFTLRFSGEGTPPLISPPVCGKYTVAAELSPWSAPAEPRLLLSKPFEIAQGVHEGACPSGGVPPFKPTVISGTENNAGGSYSPFYLRIERQDGEQEITKFSTTLPPGLTGNLTGIPFCPEADIQAAREATGAQELEHPSCPAGSEVGHTLVEAGVGSVLAQNPGKVYFAGPYHGAPFSLVSVTAAKVGPFDLGTVVIRFALDINPITAQVEVSGAQSEAIPHIIKGIVVHVRDIRVYMSREKFIENPTNCEAMSITNAITGADPADTADQETVGVSTPFQAADCASLAFRPTFEASTSGMTSRRKGASLHVGLSMPQATPGSEANIHEVKVQLPIALPSRLEPTLKNACTARQFEVNPAGCPEDSVVGYAKALTPILPVALEGPAYFVSNGIVKFPELVLVLQGYGITIDLHGETFISKKGITTSTFEAVPDQPVSSFELSLPEGPHSALAANGNLCKKNLAMPTLMIAQNGAQYKQTTKISVEGCPEKLLLDSHEVKGRTLTLRVTVPAAGKLTATGKGLSSVAKKSEGRETLTIKLKETKKSKHRKSKVKLAFKPTKAKTQKQTLAISFGKTKHHKKKR